MVVVMVMVAVVVVLMVMTVVVGMNKIYVISQSGLSRPGHHSIKNPCPYIYK